MHKQKILILATYKWQKNIVGTQTLKHKTATFLIEQMPKDNYLLI